MHTNWGTERRIYIHRPCCLKIGIALHQNQFDEMCRTVYINRQEHNLKTKLSGAQLDSPSIYPLLYTIETFDSRKSRFIKEWILLVTS